MQNLHVFSEVFLHLQGNSSSAVVKRDVFRHGKAQNGTDLKDASGHVSVYLVVFFGVFSMCVLCDPSSKLILSTCQVGHSYFVG